MANTIKIRRSATSGATPTTSQLALGELAINTYDGKLFLKKDDGSASVIEVGSGATSSTPRKILLYEKANTGSAASFNGTETRFQLRDENGAIINNIASAYQLLISIDGVVQESNSSSSGTDGFYITNNTASGTDIVFLAAPASGSEFFGTSATTANFYVNNISESGSTTTIDGLVKVTGGIQATENVTPTTGSGVEIFKPSSTAGQISAFDRNGSAWMDLILKGKEQIFYADGSEAMRVDSSGDVGINTGAAINLSASGRKTLAINGNSETAISFSHSGTLSAFFYTSADEFRMQSEIAIPLVFRPNNSEAMRIDTDGLVGIGTSTLNEQLNIHGASGAQVQFRDNGTGEAANAGFRIGWNGSVGQLWLFESAAIRFATGNSEKMRLESNGDLKLQHTGKYMLTEGTTDAFSLSTNGANGNLSIRDEYNNYNVITINNSARVGIGTTTPTRTLTVQGDMNLLSGSSIESDSSSGNLLIQGGSTYPGGCILMGGGTGTNDIRFSTTGVGTSVSSTERLRILSGGGLTFNGDTAQANALDDYEEGTWTPASGGNFGTFTNAVGHYVKIGSFVHCTFQFNASSASSSNSGQVLGLPFIPDAHNPGTGIQSTNVVYETSATFLIWAEENNTPQAYIATNKPLQGTTNTSGVFIRGSFHFQTAT